MNNSFKSPASRRTFPQSKFKNLNLSSTGPYMRSSGSIAARCSSDPSDYSRDAGNVAANVENHAFFRSPGAVPPYNFGPTEADDAPLLHPYFHHESYGRSGTLNSLQHRGFTQDNICPSPQPIYDRNVPPHNTSDLHLGTGAYNTPDNSGEDAFYGYKRGGSMVASSSDIMAHAVPSSPIFMNFQQDRPSVENRSYSTQMQLESGFGSYPLQRRREAYSPVYMESGSVKADSDVRSQTPPSSSVTGIAAAIPATSTSAKTTSNKPPTVKEEADNTRDTLKRRQGSNAVVMAFSGSTDKTKNWQKAAEVPEKELLFEVVAPLVAVRQGGHRFAKTLLLRENGKPTQQWDFFEIDRPLPSLYKGQLVRCVGRLVNKHKLQAFSVRPASEQEKSQLGRLGFISQRIINGMGSASS